MERNTDTQMQQIQHRYTIHHTLGARGCSTKPPPGATRVATGPRVSPAAVRGCGTRLSSAGAQTMDMGHAFLFRGGVQAGHPCLLSSSERARDPVLLGGGAWCMRAVYGVWYMGGARVWQLAATEVHQHQATRHADPRSGGAQRRSACKLRLRGPRGRRAQRPRRRPRAYAPPLLRGGV